MTPAAIIASLLSLYPRSPAARCLDARRPAIVAALDAAHRAPPAAPTREARALAVLGAAGAVSHELADAMADGVVTSEEVERAAPALARLLRTLDALRRPVGEA